MLTACLSFYFDFFSSLFCLALGSYRLYSLAHGLLVPKELHRHHRLEQGELKSSRDPVPHLEILIQLIDEGDACWKVATHDLLIRHVVQVLHDPTQGVPMRCDQDLLPFLHKIFIMY